MFQLICLKFASVPNGPRRYLSLPLSCSFCSERKKNNKPWPTDNNAWHINIWDVQQFFLMLFTFIKILSSADSVLSFVHLPTEIILSTMLPTQQSILFLPWWSVVAYLHYVRLDRFNWIFHPLYGATVLHPRKWANNVKKMRGQMSVWYDIARTSSGIMATRASWAHYTDGNGKPTANSQQLAANSRVIESD